MSSSIGRNSLIMASGTAASRVTGLLRTILLAAALGTTGLAANAYQTGAMIPQVIFTVVSGGVFNAVLVPQIVRTLKEEDAEQRLNRLITMAITLMLAVTVLMMAATPLLTALYVDSSWNAGQRALVNAFTLWCMPQIFFYGLYTVLGQVLAARNHFGTYAWSSVGANIISCAGFTAFILLFGKANQQPVEFWTTGKVALTAGCWTLGVAFQALVLFVPMARLGIRYRPSWGIRGIGLRSMGPVAFWSLGIMGVQELANIVNTRITTGAPERASALYSIDISEVAGNATYQNAYTLYILPYSLIAVSVATAIFPKISAAVARRDLAEARDDLSSALRNTGLLMMFFTVALVVLPIPITLVLLPSAGPAEASLIAGPLVALSSGLILISAYLLIQRTFFAFEDGKHPFLFMSATCMVQIIIEVVAVFFVPPEHWATVVGVAFNLGYLVCFPGLIVMLRKRFQGMLDGRRIAVTYGKACIAGLVAGMAGYAALRLWPLSAPLFTAQPSLSWGRALLVCVVVTIVIAIVYVGMLWLLRTEELITVCRSLRTRFVRSSAAAPPADTTQGQNTQDDPSISTSPTDTMATTPQLAYRPVCRGVEGTMKPQLGDTIIDRYALVSPLCEGQGLQVWKATDQVLDQECQLFIVLDASAVDEADTTASMLAMSTEHRCTPILHIHHEDESALIVTEPDAGVSLSEYLDDERLGTLDHDAIRSIIGDTAYTVRHLMESGAVHHAISADTVRLSASGIQLADTPVSMLIADPVASADALSPEELAVRQLAALLYQLLTHRRFEASSSLDDLPDGTPYEFRLICSRGLRIGNADMPLASLPELMALLNTWVTVPDLGGQRIPLPASDGQASIQRVSIRPTAAENIIIDSDIITSHSVPDADEDIDADRSAAVDDGNAIASLWHKGRDLLAEGIDSGHHEESDTVGLIGPFSDNTQMTVPLDFSAAHDEPANPFEETSRIPIIGADGTPVGTASSQALQAEQQMPDGSVPPSFTPTQVVRAEELDDTVADERLFGRFTTKTVAIVAAVVLLAAALIGTMCVLSGNSDSTITRTHGEAWPDFDPDAVPFGDDGNGGDDTADDDSDATADTSATAEQSGRQDTDADDDARSDADAAKESDTRQVITDDKQASAVPTPRHVNNTAFDIQSQTFLDSQASNGYGYAVHLAQPQDVYRMVITIRSSGGHGYVRVNTSDPNAGEQVADFTFAEGGTTEVMFDKLVHTQDILVWVPTEDLPQNQLYIDDIQFF